MNEQLIRSCVPGRLCSVRRSRGGSRVGSTGRRGQSRPIPSLKICVGEVKNLVPDEPNQKTCWFESVVKMGLNPFNDHFPRRKF